MPPPRKAPAGSWQLYHVTRDAWKAMLADCALAKRTIDLEQYLFVDDAAGREFLELLARKARSGVRVRMLLDGAGSFGMYMASPMRELVDAGVQVRFYNPISIWRAHNMLSWYFRDHRKILVVDGKVGYTGGVCIEAVMADWRDTHLRLTDPVVGEMAEAFERMWDRVTLKGSRRFPKPLARSRDFSFLTNSPRFRERFVYHALIDAIRGATGTVYLTSPYFVPDPRFFRVLRLAARRGVDVRLLFSGPSDHAWVDLAAHSYYERAFRAGIRIFRYVGSAGSAPEGAEPGRRLHAKIAVIDGRWASVGTVNLDNLSLLFNYEDSIVTTNAKMVRELGGQFLEDLRHAPEVTRAEWRRRPLREKFLEKIVWPLHRFF